jgi:amino acid adenylation domain-containing protein
VSLFNAAHNAIATLIFLKARKVRQVGSNCTIMTDMMESDGLLWSGFLQSSAKFPDRPALEVAGCSVSYEDLAGRAMSLAATLQTQTPSGAVPLTAVLVYRSATAYAAVLGTLMAGHGYVPLNPMFPAERTRLMLKRSTCRSIIADQASEVQLDSLLADMLEPLVVVCPDRADVTELTAKFPAHRFIGANDLQSFDRWQPANVDPNSVAYLLFTSGSTGQPKGVMVSHRNVGSYLDSVVHRYGINEQDRCSQTFDMTFDLSVHDMFVTWKKGACLCCPTYKALIKPGTFIVDAKLTVWFSVPSVAVFMKKLGMLKPGMYPSLRLSLFCGEALPLEIAKSWAGAAPNSVIENIYGPTELTIACTAYRWDNTRSPSECEHGIVPIGRPFAGLEARVVDEQLCEVDPGGDGELLMGGPQLALGYWQDAEKTAAAFISLRENGKMFYRTGDRVRRPVGAEPFIYLGRLDHQIKIMGHRVELGEVEAVIREEAGVDAVVALGWPINASGASAIEAFLQANEDLDVTSVQQRLAARLPAYMVPRRLHILARLPLNSNGKYDRKELLNRLKENE